MIKVDYVDHMGTDLTVVNSARISFNGTKTELDDKDIKLINYLAEHEHMSPFEHCSLSVIIECPLYIRSQIHRHRTFAFNEVSRRYTSDNMEFFLPSIEDLRKQSKSNRQASNGQVDEQTSIHLISNMADHHRYSEQLYNDLLAAGVCREQARGVLPQNLMTKFYMTGNLRNWAHFIKLRLHEGAQKEVQDVAQLVKVILLEKFPVATAKLLG